MNDFVRSEKALFTPEVFSNTQNRLVHFSKLSSISFSEGKYEKALYFLNKAREVSNSTRSDTGFSWLFSGDYRGNPLEYSYLHFYMVAAYELLADQGKTPAWSTDEIKDQKGNVLVQAQNYPERNYSAREISELRQKARAELLAWDTHLQNLRNLFPGKDYYKEDLMARTVASFIHGASSQNGERRTGELLTQDALKILEREFSRYPSHVNQDAQIEALEKKLKTLAQQKVQSNEATPSFLLVEAGVMDPYKVKRFHLGVSTIFNNIKDPGLRRQMEQVGLQVILSTAPEFGLILAAGGVAGAIGSDDDDQVHYFSDAIDRSFGFEIRFPTLPLPPADTQVNLSLIQKGKSVFEAPVPVLSPLQEMVSVEIKARHQKEMFAKALSMGGQYIAVLIPAIIAYKQAQKDNNLFQKLAVIAGFYMAKKAIDAANAPDLRSWDYLPKLIAGTLLTVPTGDYQAKVVISNSLGKEETDLGSLKIGAADQRMLFRHIGEVSILKSKVAK